MKQNRINIPKTAGILSLLCGVIVVAAIICFLIWPWPEDVSVEKLFNNLQENTFPTLISLDLLMVIGIFMQILLTLALYSLLKKSGDFLALCGLFFGIIAGVIVFTIRPLSELLSLSRQFAAAESDMKILFLAAGTALMAMTHGMAWIIQTVLLILSGICFSILIIKQNGFRKVTGYTGLINSVVGLLFWLPFIGKLFLLLNTAGSIIWFIFLSQDLFNLSKQEQMISDHPLENI